MDYIAFTLMTIALLLHAYDVVKDRTTREIKHTVMLRQYITLLFFLGTALFGFVEPFTGYGWILLAFLLMTVLSAFMFALNMAIYIEEQEEGISKNLEKRRNNR